MESLSVGRVWTKNQLRGISNILHQVNNKYFYFELNTTNCLLFKAITQFPVEKWLFSSRSCCLCSHLNICLHNTEDLLWDWQEYSHTHGNNHHLEDPCQGLGSRGEEGDQQAGGEGLHHPAAET